MSRPSIAPTTVPSFYTPAVALASVIVLVLSGTALAQPADPQNIVVIMADDLDWTELPFFNPPVQWEVDGAGVPKVDGNPSTGELRNRLPALNRMAARLYAGDASSNQRGLGQFQGPSGQYTVKPVDFASGDQGGSFFKLDTFSNSTADCADPVKDPQEENPLSNCEPRIDIYANSGGLNKIASGSDSNTAGIVFGRFYSTSAVCSPARASFMTGRHPTRLGVPRFDRPLNGTEVTIAEFLKQGCVDAGEPLCVKDPPDGGPPVVEPCECYMPPVSGSDCGGHECTCADAACYHTGLVGKWHLGLKTKQHWAPWQQGFDEFIGIAGGQRAQFSRRDLRCSPARRTETWKCWDDSAKAFVTSGSNTVPCSGILPTTCDPGQTCRADIDEYGLYLGASASPGTDKCKRAASPSAQEDVDCCKPKGNGNDKWKGWKGGSYRFKEKLTAFWDANGFVPGRDVRSNDPNKQGFPCNNVGEVKSTQCLYATRWMRDYARNFIERHALDAPPTGTRPFFLFVGFTAPHVPYSAPFRTIEHYQAPRGTLDEARIRAPGGRATYWAMLEELDEAVGAIMAKLEEIPPGAAEAPIGQTVVMFTSDHGRPGSLYGNPQLRGGKTNVLEGGIRVGMLIRGDGLFARTSTLFTDDTAVGSFTDMFQTIAAAAGYDDLAGTSSTNDSAFTEGTGDERIPLVKSCDTPGWGCGTAPGDCPGGQNKCRDRRLDGTNLVPFLKGLSNPPARDLVFAHYQPDSQTVATVEGYFGGSPNEFATGVCAYRQAVGSCTDSEGTTVSCVDDTPCDGTCDMREVRQVRAASCIVCDPQAQTQPPPCEGKMCDVLGGVCVTTDEKALCDVESPLLSNCDVIALPRCRKNSDCPKKDGQGRSCMFTARVACDECVPTSWKYRGKGKKEEGLYDLTSNPEENAKKFGSDEKLPPGDSRHDDADPPNGRLNCLNLAEPDPTTEPDKHKVYAAQQCLKLAAEQWQACVANTDNRILNVPCEFAATTTPSECTASFWQGQ